VSEQKLDAPPVEDDEDNPLCLGRRVTGLLVFKPDLTGLWSG
jgi:hypothetical protein